MRKHNMKSVTAVVVALTIAASAVTPAFAGELDAQVYAEEFVAEDAPVYTEEASAPVYT